MVSISIYLTFSNKQKYCAQQRIVCVSFIVWWLWLYYNFFLFLLLFSFRCSLSLYTLVFFSSSDGMSRRRGSYNNCNTFRLPLLSYAIDRTKYWGEIPFFELQILKIEQSHTHTDRRTTTSIESIENSRYLSDQKMYK
jgi:hypothetical protein